MICDFIRREKTRMLQVFSRGDHLMRVMAMGIVRLEDDFIHGVAKRYYKNCTDAHIEQFFAWRTVIDKLIEEDYIDLTDGYSYPFLQNRVVENFEQINYEIEFSGKQNDLIPFCNDLTKEMYKKFSYDMVTAKERSKRMKQAEE